ncbi:unnamed protein product [Ceutorhynchus assimilis]|uniref:1-acyl-sn-glycerol-3-phosphate acyltransferase n=1 Tax=Ceutorhynchus assimilis TaxID=467358 RepID=A0A9N9QSW4_9CUCU|nr:unnamed protein product [Ceutorhynchus assimilis]
MTLYVEMFVFGALLGLPFLYETRPAFGYCLKFFLYSAVVMINSVILIPVFCFRAKSVKNLILASYFCRWITHMIGVKWELRNGERLVPQKSCIIVSNHQSTLDILGIFQIWPTMGKCSVIAKKAVFWVWPFGLAAWLAGLTFINKNKANEAKARINEAVEKVARENTKLWIFPEGTRRNTGEIHPFKKGAFHAAITAQLPVMPVVFSTYYFLDSPNKRFDQGTVIIEVLEPISTKGLSPDDVDDLAEKVRHKMSEALKRLNQETKSHFQPSDNLLI